MTTEHPETAPPTDPAEPAPVRGAATAFSDYFSVLGARLCSVILSSGTVVLSSRILGPSGYAVVAYVSLVGALIFAVASGWTAAAVSRYGRERLETGGSVAAVTWARAVLSVPLILACALVAVGLRLLGALPEALTWGFVALGIAAGLFRVTAEHTIALVEVDARMKLSALWILLGQAVVAVGLILIFVTGGRSALPVVALIVGSQLLITAALGSRCRRSLWPPTFDRLLLRRILTFSVPLIAFTISQYVVSSVDIVVIGAYRGSADVGRYALAYRGYTVLQSLAMASIPVLTPLFVSLHVAGKERVVSEFVNRTVPQMTVVGAVFTGIAATFAGSIVQLLAGHRFAASADPLLVLLVGNVAYFMASLLGSVLVLYERTRQVALINLAGAAVNLAADVVLIGVFGVGIVAAAIATAAGVGLVWAAYWALARRTVGLSPQINPLVIVPAMVGVAAPLAGAGAAVVCAGALATVLAGALVLRYGGFLAAQDAALLARLDVPPVLQRTGSRLISVLAR